MEELQLERLVRQYSLREPNEKGVYKSVQSTQETRMIPICHTLAQHFVHFPWDQIEAECCCALDRPSLVSACEEDPLYHKPVRAMHDAGVYAETIYAIYPATDHLPWPQYLSNIRAPQTCAHLLNAVVDIVSTIACLHSHGWVLLNWTNPTITVSAVSETVQFADTHKIMSEKYAIQQTPHTITNTPISWDQTADSNTPFDTQYEMFAASHPVLPWMCKEYRNAYQKHAAAVWSRLGSQSVNTSFEMFVSVDLYGSSLFLCRVLHAWIQSCDKKCPRVFEQLFLAFVKNLHPDPTTRSSAKELAVVVRRIITDESEWERVTEIPPSAPQSFAAAMQSLVAGPV